MNMADYNKLNTHAKKFVDGGTRSLGTCALANHVANAGFSMLNGFLVGSYCGWQWGLFTTVFSLLGLWYLGELLPKITAAKAPEKFLNTHAKKLLRTKTFVAPIVERIVQEEPHCEVKEAEKELVSAARMADEEWSLLLLPLYDENMTKATVGPYKSYSVTKVTSINSIESIMARHARSSKDEWTEYELVCAKSLKKLGYFNTLTIIRWMMDHKENGTNRPITTVRPKS